MRRSAAFDTSVLGSSLQRSVDDVLVGDVIERMEGDLHVLSCVGTDDSCLIHSLRKLKGVLVEAQRLQKEYLSSVTRADVVPTRWP